MYRKIDKYDKVYDIIQALPKFSVDSFNLVCDYLGYSIYHVCALYIVLGLLDENYKQKPLHLTSVAHYITLSYDRHSYTNNAAQS